MTVKEIIFLVLAGVLANNYALEKFLGLTPLLGFARSEQKLLGLGLSVCGVTVLASLIAWPLQQLVLAPLGLGYLQTLLLAVLVLALVYLLQAICGKKLGFWFPVIALNSAVLGAAVNAAGAESFLTAALGSLGVGLGFLAGLYLMRGIQARIDEFAVPKAFRGLPVQLLAASILSLALLALR